MSKSKFKIDKVPISTTMFITGPDLLMIGVDIAEPGAKKKLTQQTARKVARLLNKHWDDDKKAKP